MVEYIPLSEKVIHKRNVELLELHKRVLKTYLIQKGIKVKTRNRFFKIYDFEINPDNIVSYFFLPSSIFVRAIIIGGEYLEDHKTLFFKENYGRKRSKHKNRSL